MICLPLGLGIFFNEKSRQSLLYVSLGIESMLLFLFYSFTRSCLLAVIVVTLITLSVVTILQIRGSLRLGIGKRHLVALFAMVLVFIAGACLTPRGFDVSNIGRIFIRSAGTAEELKSAASRVSQGAEFERSYKNSESESVYFRLAAWRNSLVMAGDNPVLGTGLGNLKINYPRYHRSAVYDGMSGEKKQLLNLHNDYLQVLVELGSIGFLLLMGLICVVAVTSWKALRPHDGSSVIMPAALTASLACYGIVSFFGFPASRAVHPAYVALIVAGLLACSGGIKLFVYKSSPAWLSPVLKSTAILLVVAAVVLYGKKVLEYDPSRKITYSYLGRAYNSLKQPEKGIECLKKTLQYNPWHITAMINLGASYSELGDYGKASEIFSRGLSIAPESAALHNNFGNLLSRIGKYSAALAEFSLAATHEPDNPRYVYNRGYMELLLGRRDDAIKSFKSALKLRPGWDLPQKQLRLVSDSSKLKIEE